MNVYDTANKLAQEIKSSDEYTNYKKAKESIDLKPDVKTKIMDFQKLRYEAQIAAMQEGKEDTEKLEQAQKIYAELIEIPDVKDYFNTELNFNVMLADVNKIISEAVEDVIK
ncbi:MAG: YlbF family regulator [Clostridia bacterium]|nr:YlbF family regulator [Clostridia bacterium]